MAVAVAPDRAAASTAGDAAARADLGVVVVSYRCRDHVARCLAALPAATEGLDVQVVVVDNGSEDGTVELVAERHPSVAVVPMGRNAGFAAACNVGMGRTDARHVLLLNPDTVAAPGSLAALVAFADERPGAGVVAPRLCHPDGTDQGTARSFPTPAAAVFGRRSPLTRTFPRNRWSRAYLEVDRGAGGEPFRCDWVSGACLLVPRHVVEAVGGLDEAFFLYWEDADWCRRIVDAGLEVWTVPEAVVAHHEGATRDHGWPAPVVRHFHRGAYLYWRNHHAPQAWNPARWLAAGALAARGALVAARSRLVDRSGGTDHHDPLGTLPNHPRSGAASPDDREVI